MSCQILLGRPVADAILETVRSKIQHFASTGEGVPGLSVILVGDNPASKAYVGRKQTMCESLGMRSFEHILPADSSQGALESLIESLNANPEVDGILLQLPLPKHLDSDHLLALISPDKDVDGFHPINVGRLSQGLPTFRSCTPYGIIEMLRYYQIPVEGQHVVIVGRSNIVGKPLALMFLEKSPVGNATVTICHSRSNRLDEHTRAADILVAAIGIPGFITPKMVRPGAVVIDVGINRIDDPSAPKGTRIVGDVAPEVAEVASAMTPVPNGVGPMTIAMLMKNTVEAFERNRILKGETHVHH